MAADAIGRAGCGDSTFYLLRAMQQEQEQTARQAVPPPTEPPRDADVAPTSASDPSLGRVVDIQA